MRKAFLIHDVILVYNLPPPAIDARQYAMYPGLTEGECDEPCARQLCETYGTALPRVYNDGDFQDLLDIM